MRASAAADSIVYKVLAVGSKICTAIVSTELSDVFIVLQMKLRSLGCSWVKSGNFAELLPQLTLLISDVVWEPNINYYI